MNADMIEFDFDDMGLSIRVQTIDGEPWFVASDLSMALGYSSTGAMNKLIDGDDKKMTSFHNGTTYIKQSLTNESGLYAAIFGSTMPNAKKFKKWVTTEVLPSIRKHGGYIAGQDDMSGDELLAKAVLHAQSVIAEKNKLLEEKSMRISEMEPKEHFYETVTQTTSTYRMDQVAKNINVKGMGRNKLYAYLRSKGIFQPNSTTPYQRYVNQGYFKIVTTYRNGMAFPSTVAFQKGIDYIIKLLRADGYI